MEFWERSEFNVCIQPTIFSSTPGLVFLFSPNYLYIKMEINETFMIKYKHLKVYFLFKNLLYIGVYLIYNIVLVSGVQQHGSVIHIIISIFFSFFAI